MMLFPCRCFRGCFAALLLLTAVFGFRPVWAQYTPQIGSSNAAVAEPGVSRPASLPVSVPLFQDLTFTDYASKPFAYAPPDSRKHWAKIVLVGDFHVTAGRQFDRTGEISIGHTNVYFGTTAEPSDSVGPSWHVERDLTADTVLLRVPQPGQVQIGSIVDSKYTGVIHGTVFLLFYPVAPHTAPPSVPDLVLPLPAGGNGQASVNSPTDTLTQTYTFPTNTVRVSLDLITESQGSDEFWYLGVPEVLKQKLQSEGGTAFREAEVTVDGRPAGIAPVFPWIYTGGIDPGWWRPIPGIETLNFVPYRVDLTPFAGVFSNGRPHKIGVRIVNNSSYFQVAGTLFVFRDPVLTTVHGGLLQDTLTAPTSVVQSHLTATGGPVSVTSSRRFTIAGYVLTSAGKVKTTLTQAVGFSNVQQFVLGAAQDLQNVRQLSSVSSETRTQTPSSFLVQQDNYGYPLEFTSRRRTEADGGRLRMTSVQQGRFVLHQTSRNGKLVTFSRSSDLVTPSDTVHYDAAGKVKTRDQRSTQTYTSADARGGYTRILTAENGVVTRIVDTRQPHGREH